MNTSRITSVIALSGALGLLGGCASDPVSHLVTAPPPPSPTATMGAVAAPQPVYITPAAVVVAAQPAAAVNSYVVVQAPPAPQPEAVPTRPSTQHMWIAGYWTWQNNTYAWMAGHWEVPPYASAVWVSPRSEPEGGVIRFYEGHWQ